MSSVKKTDVAEKPSLPPKAVSASQNGNTASQGLVGQDIASDGTEIVGSTKSTNKDTPVVANIAGSTKKSEAIDTCPKTASASRNGNTASQGLGADAGGNASSQST